MNTFISYKNYLNKITQNKNSRENYEWSNVWIDSANSEPVTKALLIGDSTIRMVRSTFSKVANMPVDMIGTSSPINDILFVELVDYFFRNCNCKYDYIFIQLGHHGRISQYGGAYDDVDFNEFELSFRGLIEYLHQFCDNIIVETVFDSVIPFKQSFVKDLLLKFNIYQLLYKFNIKKEVYDQSINSITSRKNFIISKIADDVDYVMFLDINEFMNHKPYIHIDHIHFEENAKKVIARQMFQQIISDIQ